ncbi:MAG: hypothetical protein HZB30_00680 [Nitrospirae bacterium]|nr:hypothetical protein [Nitrospirota bacterium]
MIKIIDDYMKALNLADTQLSDSNIYIQDLGCPHNPKGLPNEKMAVYTFQFNNRYLKIGKAGPNSDARFRSQPYSPSSSQSNLAKSILNDPEMARYNLNENNIHETYSHDNYSRIPRLKILDLFFWAAGKINEDKAI